jgi:serine/threonine-protein kinase
VKRLHTHLARNEEACAQFAVEQRLATTLPRHPNVVHGIETGEVEGRPYVVLEIAPGEDLRRIIAPPATREQAAPAGVVLARPRALAIVRAACDAAEHLHAHAWIHGDINPGNLIVDGDRVTLIDLGVARRSAKVARCAGPTRTWPEQVRGNPGHRRPTCSRSASCCGSSVAGARLFHRGPPWLSMAAVVEATPPPLADRVLDAIVQAALVKDPTQRVASAAELARLLCD